MGGIWSLNKSLSEAPKEIGFDVVLPNVGDTLGQTAPPAGGRGRRGSRSGGGGTPFATRPESYEDGQRMRILVGEVREPSTRLTIVDTPSVVTITNDLGQSRVLHPNGLEESIDVENIPINVTAAREAFFDGRDRDRAHADEFRDQLLDCGGEALILDHGTYQPDSFSLRRVNDLPAHSQ